MSSFARDSAWSNGGPEKFLDQVATSDHLHARPASLASISSTAGGLSTISAVRYDGFLRVWRHGDVEGRCRGSDLHRFGFPKLGLNYLRSEDFACNQLVVSRKRLCN